MSGKFALIIGNTEYIDPGLAQLTAPGKDAEDFARVLKDQEIGAFDSVNILLNQISSSVIEAIDEFFDQKKPDDLLVLYFSGHGVRDELGSLYLAVRNTIRTRLRSTAIKSDYIRDAMDQSRSKRQVLILDCCNSGAFPQGTKTELGGAMGMTKAFQGYGRFVLTASDATQFAWEGDKVIGKTDNSLFTHFLVKGLEGEADSDGDGRITVDELYDYTYDQISKVTPKQTPTKSSSKVEGEIILRQSTRIENIKPVPLPTPLLDSIENPFPDIRLGAVQQLTKLLNGKNLGLARSAREALEHIAEDDDSRQVSRAAIQALEAIHQTEQLMLQKAEEARLAAEKLKAEQKAFAEAERLAKQKAEEERIAKVKKVAERLAEEKRLAAEKAESERKAKEEAEHLAQQKAEEERIAKAKIEAQRLAAQKAEAERKGKEEAQQLAARKAKEERLARESVEAKHKTAEHLQNKPESVKEATPKKIGAKTLEAVTPGSKTETQTDKVTVKLPGEKTLGQSPLTRKWGKTLIAGVVLITCGIFSWLLIKSSFSSNLPGTTSITPTPSATEFVTFTAIPTSPMAGQSPVNFERWKVSGHANEKAEAFVHWNNDEPREVPASCARCHTLSGFQEYLANGNIATAIPAPAGTLVCETCHNDTAKSTTSVTFPSGKVINNLGQEVLCITCHQGRTSKISIDNRIADFNAIDPDTIVAPIKDSLGNDVWFGFLNVHYLAAGATLYGSEAQMGYEYDGKIYEPKYQHFDGTDTCISCHDPHSLKIQTDKCAECHAGELKDIRMQSSLTDYNGNGNINEGIYIELKGLQDILSDSIKAYANEVASLPIFYDPATYPYFFTADKDGNRAKDAMGNYIAYSNWTPRLLKAAYNYQVSVKDPGAYAHNAKYIIALLYDSIEDLNGVLTNPVDINRLHRDDPGHFAGGALSFRDWDLEGEIPANCAKCHSSKGLPEYLANNGNLVVTQSGLQITGIVSQPVSNSFMCSTCHDEANWPNRYAVSYVPFPNGARLTFSTEKDDNGRLKPVDANLCIECHQGRESTVTLNNHLVGRELDTVDIKVTFKNIHYFAAGATLFGADAMGAYQYNNKNYVGFNSEHPLRNCTDCHDAHALNVKEETCKGCHGDFKEVKDIRAASDTVDYNGDGDVSEGIYKEIDSLRSALYMEIQRYAKTKSRPIVYDANYYPYFFLDENEDGKADTNDQGARHSYNANWTPRLLKAAYNYQYSIKDPGAFAHNPKYVIQFLIDSIEDLGGDVSRFTRP